ncbi:TPA: DNA cytosine methyltransferase, partial [Clostridioides difficile]
MYNVIDLFAGAGGLSLGFEMTKKFNMVAFVEKNDNAAKTYLENHPSVKRYCDIKRLDFQDILNSVDKIDVVIGGPPCQGFSNANRQKRKIINGNNELVKLYVDAIDKLKPNVFVMENVKTISSNKHSFYLTKKDKNHIINNLKLNIYNK